jgi:hypothetical protein
MTVFYVALLAFQLLLLGAAIRVRVVRQARHLHHRQRPAPHHLNGVLHHTPTRGTAYVDPR